MPLEVREIGIRMNVGDSAEPREAEAEAAARIEPGLSPGERSALVDECVQAVLTALRMRSER